MSVTLIPVSVICEITASLAAMQFTQLTFFFLISTEKLLFSAAEVCVQYLTLEINIILDSRSFWGKNMYIFFLLIILCYNNLDLQNTGK